LSETERITRQFVAGGANAEELRQAKLYITGLYPSELETSSGIADQLLTAEQFGLGLDYIDKYIPTINAVTLSQVNAAARKHIHPNSAVVVLAGAAAP
jgi:zinc protease